MFNGPAEMITPLQTIRERHKGKNVPPRVHARREGHGKTSNTLNEDCTSCMAEFQQPMPCWKMAALRRPKRRTQDVDMCAEKQVNERRPDGELYPATLTQGHQPGRESKAESEPRILSSDGVDLR